MRKTLIFLFICPVFLWAETSVSDVPSRLTQARDDYFAGKPQQALEQYIEISKETQNRDAFLNAAYIALEQGNPKQAVDISTSAYLLYPQDPEVTEFVAEAYMADGQYENAEKFFSFLEEEGERSEFLFINMARAQLGMGETDLALRNLKRAAKGSDHLSLANYLLGQIYEQKAQWRNAAKAFGKAVDYDHQFTEARAHYANALEKSKQYNEAYRQYRILHTAIPKNQVYSAAIPRLRPKLTKKEVELEARKPKDRHTLVKPVVSLEGNLQQVRVGLGATATGKPSKRDTIIFSPSHPFTVTLKSNGKNLAIGKGKQIWKAELKDGKATLVSPDGKTYPFSNAIIITPKSAESQQGATILIKKVMSGAGMTWASEDGS